jgi:16S rRNA G966 N2-methylase RsmD
LPLNTFCLRKLRKAVEKMRHHRVHQLSMWKQAEIFDPVSVTFKGGAKEPFVRWYPYLEGYSPQYVETILNRYSPEARIILDPFAGTGTTAFTAAELNKTAFFCEINPLLQFIAQLKIRVRRLGPHQRMKLAEQLEGATDLSGLGRIIPDDALHSGYLNVFGKSRFFEESVYEQVLKLRTYIDDVVCANPLLGDLVMMAVIPALVPASEMQRAGDLRCKRANEKKRALMPLLSMVSNNLAQIAGDIRQDLNGLGTEPCLIAEDARSLTEIPYLNVDTVVTSPPFVNGTNYFRNTKIELWFMRCLQGKQDLANYRANSVTAGINDVSVGKTPSDMHPEVEKIVRLLEENAYDPRIPRMIACYFQDMARVFSAVEHHLADDATIAIDIGDSRYGGIHVPVDRLLSACLEDLGFQKTDEVVLRRRKSRDSTPLKQCLLVFRKRQSPRVAEVRNAPESWRKEWGNFKDDLPHQRAPYASRNWGHPRHSLCSFPGKLKPSIAYHLVRTFVPEGGSILDPFAGVGTIPLEAALQGRRSFGFEISPAAFVVANAKLQPVQPAECEDVIESLTGFIKNNPPAKEDLDQAHHFGFNGKIVEYYEIRTLNEILSARRFFLLHPPRTAPEMFVNASLLHILHGNRPYALSRRSHPLTPYKPSGEFEYRSLTAHLHDKVRKTLRHELTGNFVPGKIFLQDSTGWWPRAIESLDAVITSPPFFHSTRFYLANWLRLWFTGWSQRDFETRPFAFVDERQKKSFDVYSSIFRQARERLKPGGVLVLHLGKSTKCDMAVNLKSIGLRWFKSADVFDESVAHCESHGIRDKGSVTSHQYLVLS